MAGFDDIPLFKIAMTHSSYCRENALALTECNERLEFLGDAVLKICIRVAARIAHIGVEIKIFHVADFHHGEIFNVCALPFCETKQHEKFARAVFDTFHINHILARFHHFFGKSRENDAFFGQSGGRCVLIEFRKREIAMERVGIKRRG